MIFYSPIARRKPLVLDTGTSNHYHLRMINWLPVAALVATLISLGEFSLAKSEVIETKELTSWYLIGDSTLCFYDLDGGARTTFLMKLDDNKIAVASFSWGLRPGAKPTLQEAILIVGGKVTVSKSHLEYDFQSINGTISTDKFAYTVNVAKSDIQRLDVWSSKNRKFIFSEFDELMAPLPLKIVKPK